MNTNTYGLRPRYGFPLESNAVFSMGESIELVPTTLRRSAYRGSLSSHKASLNVLVALDERPSLEFGSIFLRPT